MTAPIDSFYLYDRTGQLIGRVEGSLDGVGEPVVRIVTAGGSLHCELTGNEVRQLAILLGKLKAARR
ncbi:MAG: hypothetical protein RIB84_22465 [Sneathiellaceae bacterium]